MSNPTCADCKHGTITLHSSKDRCSHASNTDNHPPYALRHDQSLCGETGKWFEAKSARSAEYKAEAK